MSGTNLANGDHVQNRAGAEDKLEAELSKHEKHLVGMLAWDQKNKHKLATQSHALVIFEYVNSINLNNYMVNSEIG